MKNQESCQSSSRAQAHIDTAKFRQGPVPVHEARVGVGIGDAVGPFVGEVAEPDEIQSICGIKKTVQGRIKKKKQRTHKKARFLMVGWGLV